MSQEKSSLREDLQRTREELDRARSRKANYDPAEVEALQGQMANLKAANEQVRITQGHQKVVSREMGYIWGFQSSVEICGFFCTNILT